jgi:LacI family transcriptional regulator
MGAKGHVHDVALLLDTSTGWGRRVVEGILAYAQESQAWNIWIEPHGLNEDLQLPEGWSGDGVIARISSSSIAQRLMETHAKVVNVSRIEVPETNQFYRVTSDPVSSAKLAFEHFRRRGFWHFAYVEPYDLPVVQEHYRAYAHILAEHGMHLSLFQPCNRDASAGTWSGIKQAMTEWLQGLEKPVAIYTWAADVGRMVINQCVQAGISVPHEVAVLGGDDDSLLCNATRPPQSGIIVPAGSIGRTAAKLLDDLMHGKEPRQKQYVIASQQINERASTDILALKDRQMVQALQYLRENFNRPISVADLLKVVPMGRRTMELKFQKQLGRSPANELKTLRLAHAQKLLVETDMSLQDIAESCGLSTYNYLTHFFKKHSGQTPGLYRRKARHASGAD